MLPKLLFPAPKSPSVRHIEDVCQICNKEFQIEFGRENKMPRRGKGPDSPVVAATLSGLSGYWSLDVNDPEIDGGKLDRLVENIKKWYGTPMVPRV